MNYDVRGIGTTKRCLRGQGILEYTDAQYGLYYRSSSLKGTGCETSCIRDNKQGTYAREHVRDGTRHFNAEQARDAEQKAEETGHKAAPDENLDIPLGVSTQFQDLGGFTMEKNEWSDEDGRSCICPICELDSRVVAVRKRRLD